MGTAVVTGAGRGIGREIARLLVARGLEVLVTDVYGATKHAVLGFTESLQGDLDDSGIPIRTHAICPDGVDTAMVRERQADEESAIIFSTPRFHTPQEVARKAVSAIGERKPVIAIPAGRAVLVRTMALFPKLNLRLIPLFKKAGEKKRAKA